MQYCNILDRLSPLLCYFLANVTTGTFQADFGTMSKGNRQRAGVKSASSHMAAELLTRGSLVTFDTLSGGFPSMEETEDTISLKKLSKRDSSTREKALRELMERCTKDNSDTVLSTFSQFAIYFDKIIFDCSPIVRHLAMRLVSKQVNLLKKKAERDLFSILPWVLFASCDPYSPCATEAIQFLNSLFSPDKLELIMDKMSGKLLKILDEILISGESMLLVPSKLVNNDEEDSANERRERLSEQSYGVLAKIIKREGKEEAESILTHRLANLKKNEMSHGLLHAISQCADPVHIISGCSLFDQLLSPFISTGLNSLLPLCTDLILLVLTSTSFTLNENQKKKVVTTLLTFIKKANLCDLEWLGVRLLPLFSRISSLVDISNRPSLISSWFASLQSNGNQAPNIVLYTGDCIKFVLALLDSPTVEETSDALDMIFFLISQSSSSSDPYALQSLIIWTIGRLSESKVHFFLEEVVRRCFQKLPSSRPLLNSLLSLHNDHLLFAWEYLHTNGLTPLPLHLLNHAQDEQLLSLNESIGIMDRMEEYGDPSLASLYCRLHSLLPSSSRQREKPLQYSRLMPAILSIMDGSSISAILSNVDSSEKRSEWLNGCVEEWTKNGDIESTIKLYSLMEKEQNEMEDRLLALHPPLPFLIQLAASSQFSSKFGREVAIGVVRESISQCLKDTKSVCIPPSSRSIVQKLEVAHILTLITDEVAMSSLPLKVSSFHSMATLIFDLVENGINLLEGTPFFLHLLSILSTPNAELSHYALLCHYWPSSIDDLPYRPDESTNLPRVIEELSKTLTLFLALYVHRPCESFSSVLLISIIILSSIIKLSRCSHLCTVSKPEGEGYLLSYSTDIIENGGTVVSMDELSSLLLLSSPSSRSLLIYSLRPLHKFISNGAFPPEMDSPFSALPTQGFTLHLEVARQLFYSRKRDQTLRLIYTDTQSKEGQSNEELFTLQCDNVHFSLSMSLLTGANEYLNEEREENEELSDALIDFIDCSIVTALTSVNSDSESDSKWENKRRLLGAAAIQLAIKRTKKGSEEWNEFFLPSITPLVLRMYGQMDLLDRSALSRMVNLFIINHPSLSSIDLSNEKWDKRNVKYDMDMDEAGIPSTIQTLIVFSSRVLEDGKKEDGEAIIAASNIIAMCAVATFSFSSSPDDKGVTVVLPPFMKNLAAKDGWSRCGVTMGCLSLLSTSMVEGREGNGESGVERSILCDSMAPLITMCLTTIVSKTEEESHAIPSRFFIEKPIPSSGYLLHWTSYLLRETFSAFPSIVKMWYTGLPKSASTLVNSFISSKLSSILIDNELSRVMEGDLCEKYKTDQVTPTIRRHSNEILMDYIMEDTRMRLSIVLPNGWPLVAASVSVEGSIVGVEDGRKWMLQLNSQLIQNASVLSALSAWLKHAGAKVEGAECCTICMLLVSPQTKQLPKARCRTCANKFHSSCLYRWFESSGQSSCPLCRSDFTS